MKYFVSLALSLTLVSCGSLTNSVDWVDYGDDPLQNPDYLNDMTDAGTPGAEHEALAARAGSWTVAGQMWMEPGMDPMPMNASAKFDVILGGRYTTEEFKSDFMGMPFEGRLTMGYDKVTNRYWSLWCDSASTGYWLAHGTETTPGNIELHGTAQDILTPNGRPMRMTMTANADGTHTMRMYDTRAGVDEYMSMELVYSRE